jgi:hypothetical protein
MFFGPAQQTLPPHWDELAQLRYVPPGHCDGSEAQKGLLPPLGTQQACDPLHCIMPQLNVCGFCGSQKSDGPDVPHAPTPPRHLFWHPLDPQSESLEQTLKPEPQPPDMHCVVHWDPLCCAQHC